MSKMRVRTVQNGGLCSVITGIGNGCDPATAGQPSRGGNLSNAIMLNDYLKARNGCPKCPECDWLLVKYVLRVTCYVVEPSVTDGGSEHLSHSERATPERFCTRAVQIVQNEVSVAVQAGFAEAQILHKLFKKALITTPQRFRMESKN